MHIIDEATSAALITRHMAYDAIRASLAAAVLPDCQSFPVVIGNGPGEGQRFGIKSATTPTITGFKVGSYWPGNEARGETNHHSSIVLLHPESGRIAAVIEGGKVNTFRTAAANAVAADVLAHPDAATLTVFGNGHQAHHEVLALALVRPIRQVLVVGRDPARVAAFCDGLQAQGINARPEAAEAACRQADIITTVTTSRAPLFDAAWVRPGTHISSMGSDTVGKQELPVALLREGTLFCDLERQSRVVGEFQHAPADVPATSIGHVLDGSHPGRTRDDQITVFDSSGISVQDLYIGEAILQAWLRSQENQGH